MIVIAYSRSTRRNKRSRTRQWTWITKIRTVSALFSASGIGGIKTFDEEVLSYAKIKDTIGPKFNPFFIPKMISDIAAGHISMLYGFHGPNFATVSACASSTNAISDAQLYPFRQG